MGGMASADPAVRLSALVDQFPGRHARASICNDDLGPATVAVGGELERLVVGDRCLARALAATDDCSVVDETAGQPAASLAQCGQTSATTCYAIVADTDCSSGYRLDVARAAPAPADTFTTLRCRR
jgi:hypothetical protein